MTYPLYAVVEAPSVLGLFPGGVETSPTGNGLGGGVVAMMVGLIGMALGGLALARSRRTA